MGNVKPCSSYEKWRKEFINKNNRLPTIEDIWQGYFKCREFMAKSSTSAEEVKKNPPCGWMPSIDRCRCKGYSRAAQ